MPSVLPPSIPDTSLGLTNAELYTFRQHQSIALQGQGVTSSRASVTSTRGRGTSRNSVASSSRAGSAASSAGGGNGRLMLDAGSLSALGSYFERLMGRIQERVHYVSCALSNIRFSSTRLQGKSQRYPLALPSIRFGSLLCPEILNALSANHKHQLDRPRLSVTNSGIEIKH